MAFIYDIEVVVNDGEDLQDMATRTKLESAKRIATGYLKDFDTVMIRKYRREDGETVERYYFDDELDGWVAVGGF